MNYLDHRAKAYSTGGFARTIIYTGHTTQEFAGQILDQLLSLPCITGGHLERHEQGIGWVLADDDANEVERRRIDCDTLYPY